MGRRSAARSRAKGHIEELPSGGLRVSVYAGIDPVTGKRHYLREVIAPGSKAMRTAEQTRDRFLREVADKRNPRTSATIDQLLTRYMEQFDGSPNTVVLYEGYIRKHISPYLGKLKVGALDADILDSFYAELRRCRIHCAGKRFVQHRTGSEHECDDRCRDHVCRPLGASTVRHMHFILSGAYRKAVRWRWVAVSPITQAEPPAAPKSNPSPPTPPEAARIITEAWRDPDWGTLIWTAMTTGARRGELAALQWADLDLTEGRETVWLRRAVRKERDGTLVEAQLKTHQQRRIALDPETAHMLRELRTRWESRLAQLQRELSPTAYLFSGAPDAKTFPRPEGISQRYERLAERLEIKTTFHKLRHYTATELIAAGVDVRTVAGRLGHGGGGTTTLRTYSAWVSEADQRAATGLGSGMPARPIELDEVIRQQTQPRHPYEVVAAEIRRQVLAGEIRDGARLPTEPQLVADHGVSISTLRRATALLRTWGILAPTGRTVIGPKLSPSKREPLSAAVKTPRPARGGGKIPSTATA
ncbi:MAG TPA: tyrosine-type recombinase/integrase [Pseudonocardia sp.]|nr:tyrosine-type recombinase/integrase [Pseudonocardia sp.]